MIGKRDKAKEAGEESRRGFQGHVFVKEEAGRQNGDHPSQTIERGVVQHG